MTQIILSVRLSFVLEVDCSFLGESITLLLSIVPSFSALHRFDIQAER